MSFGIYVHHPWCVRKCAYCAFNVYTDSNPPFQEWKNYIMRDWNKEKEFVQGQPSSIYFGGGTPSLAPVSVVEDILLQFDAQENAEVTLEINPGDLNKEHLKALKHAGVSRYSVGIQSFNPRFSKLLNRSHTVHDNHELLSLFSIVQPKTWSLDLIFGLPDQSIDELNWDIDQALQHNPPHISIYGLTVEEDTPLARGVKNGIIQPLDEESWRAQFACLMNRLEEEGYEQYEVSNFARPDHRSKHNEHVWRNGHYVGLGPGAHGFRPDGTRTIQKESWEEWCSSDHLVVDKPTEEQAFVDQIISSIRHIDGIPLDFINQNHRYLDELVKHRWEQAGLLRCSKTHITLTKKGVFLADWLTQQIIEKICVIKD